MILHRDKARARTRSGDMPTVSNLRSIQGSCSERGEELPADSIPWLISSRCEAVCARLPRYQLFLPSPPGLIVTPARAAPPKTPSLLLPRKSTLGRIRVVRELSSASFRHTRLRASLYGRNYALAAFRRARTASICARANAIPSVHRSHANLSPPPPSKAQRSVT